MKRKSGIVCTGCGIDAADTGEYSKDNPVEADGTYADGKFVCTPCYCRLIDSGYDVGEPRVIQARAARLSTAGKACSG